VLVYGKGVTMAGKKSFLSILLAGLISFTNILQADVTTIGSNKDNTLYENASGSLSNGAGSFFFVGQSNQRRESI